MNTPKGNEVGDWLLTCIILLLAVMLGSCGADLSQEAMAIADSAQALDLASCIDQLQARV